MNDQRWLDHLADGDLLKTEISGWYRGPIMASPGVEIHAMCHPPDGACGDYIGVYQLGDGRLAIVVADATGHGAAASEILGAVDAVGGEVDLRQTSPARFLATVSKALMADHRLRGGEFITAAFMLLDLGVGFAKVALAGHPAPLLIRQGRLVEHAWSRGAPLGVMTEPGATDNDIRLRPGDQFIIYTDGVPDSASIGGDWRRATELLRAAGAHDDPSAALIAGLGGDACDAWARDDSSALFLRIGANQAQVG